MPTHPSFPPTPSHNKTRGENKMSKGQNKKRVSLIVYLWRQSNLGKKYCQLKQIGMVNNQDKQPFPTYPSLFSRAQIHFFIPTPYSLYIVQRMGNEACGQSVKFSQFSSDAFSSLQFFSAPAWPLHGLQLLSQPVTFSGMDPPSAAAWIADFTWHSVVCSMDIHCGMFLSTGCSTGVSPGAAGKSLFQYLEHLLPRNPSRIHRSNCFSHYCTHYSTAFFPF